MAHEHAIRQARFLLRRLGAREGWERHTAPATECPRIRAAFLEEERAAMGYAWFAQEYLCEFIDDGGAWFTRALVEEALCDGDPLWL